MALSFQRADGSPKTVIVTGGAGGIGAQTIRTYYSKGCNVVIADLPLAKDAAESLISSLPEPSRAIYQPTNIVHWEEMRALFREAKKKFGQVDIVVANAGMMESKGFFEFEEDENGELKEPVEGYRVLDVNLKGTMNSKCRCESLCYAHRMLMIGSPAVSNALHEIQSTRLGGRTRLCHSYCFDIWLLRRHWCCVIHCLQARRRGSRSLITARSKPTQCARERNCTIFHTHVYHRRLFGGVEKAGTTSEYGRGSRGGDRKGEHRTREERT